MAEIYRLRNRATKYAVKKAVVAISLTGLVVVGGSLFALHHLTTFGRKD